MHRNPALTFEGALKILGKHDHPWLERLNGLLGGVVLGAGVGALVSPAAGLAALWGWVDQKNEALDLLKQALDGISDRLLGTRGYERHQLIAAAHTTIVMAAYLETLRVTVDEPDVVEIDDRSTIADLYSSPVPAPSAAVGFEENSARIAEWYFTVELKRGTGPALRSVDSAVINAAINRYRTHYIDLCAKVPEFLVWASLGEHAATRTSVHGVRTELLTALDGHAEVLSRLERVLLALAPQADRTDDVREIVYRTNRAELDEPIVPASAARHYGSDLRFPAVGDIFVNPRHRVASYTDARPTDEDWWRGKPVHDDLDLRIAAHLTTPEAVDRPLLVLGHPGAGKSLLTKVLAARLPASSYTVVRVPLRRVGADSPVYAQIQQALDHATHERVDWPELVRQSGDTIRVVLLDGLDELLQAASVALHGYLQDVAEFQRREADLGRPVVVIVTSRTVVLDRVEIPAGTTMIKLESFDDAQITRWLAEWHRTNAAAIAGGTLRELPTDVALGQRDLAGQPLLLLMLALYAADPGARLEPGMSTVELYRRLIENFARREVTKSPVRLTPDEITEAVEDHVYQLSVAALAMFNRGRQDVTADELGADLAALESGSATMARAADSGHRVIGQFFFVHTAEAQDLSTEDPRRSYEFLHATFGEYLVARHVVDELAAMARSERGGRREPDDELLFALLSHQALAVSRTTLVFAAELFASLPDTERQRVPRLLETLASGFRHRHGSDRYSGYRPMPVDRVRHLAAYSANLVVLRVMLGSSVPLVQLHQGQPDALTAWRSTLALWQAGLDTDAWQAILSTLSYGDGRLGLLDEFDVFPSELAALASARLAGDRDTERRLRFGVALTDNVHYALPGDQPEDVMYAWLASALTRREVAGFRSEIPDFSWDDIAEHDRIRIIGMIEMVLKTRTFAATRQQLADLLRLVLDHSPDGRPDPYALLIAIKAHPALLSEIPELRNPGLYQDADAAAAILDQVSMSGRPELRRLRMDIAESKPYLTVDAIVVSILNGYRWRRPPSGAGS